MFAIVAYGSHYVGKTERIPGVLWVSTRFLHVMFFPFVPRDSWLFVDKATRADLDLQVDALPIPLQARSVALAWLRALLVLVLLVASLVSVTKYLLDRPLGDQLVASLFVVVPAAALVASSVLDRPTPERVHRLLMAAGAPPALMARAKGQLGQG